MILAAYIAAYVLLTAGFWLGNRNVPRKKPINSSIKWLLWTTTYVSLATMIHEIPGKGATLDAIVGPMLISPFVYPMVVSTAMREGSLPTIAIVLAIAAPLLAAATGYRLAVRHNAKRDAARARGDAGAIRS